MNFSVLCVLVLLAHASVATPSHVNQARELSQLYSSPDAAGGYPFWWHEVPLSTAQHHHDSSDSGSSSSSSSSASPSLPRGCTLTTSVNETCTLHPLNIRPTQFTLGMAEVDCRASYISKLSAEALYQYLNTRPVPLVRGPGGIFYQVDRHHLSCALMASTVPDSLKLLHCVVVLDYSHLPAELFWPTMMAGNMVFVENPSSHSFILPAFLPHHIDELVNDPYRALAYWVRKNGGYAKSLVPYQDSHWADYFRARVPLPTVPTNAQLAGVAFNWCTFSPYDHLCLLNQTQWIEANLDVAIQLAQEPGAAALPGWGPGSVGGVHC